jgi:hypothetical protein
MTAKEKAVGPADVAGANPSIKVNVDGLDIKVTRVVDEATALAVISLIMGGTAIPKALTGGIPGVKDLSQDFGMTLREYLTQQEAKSIQEKITAMGWYFMNIHQKKSFSIDEILIQFDDVREKRPKNPVRDVNETIKKNWLTTTPDGEYLITGTGQKAVEAKFAKEAIKKVSVRR